MLTSEHEVHPCWFVEWVDPGMDGAALYAYVSGFHSDDDAIIEVAVG